MAQAAAVSPEERLVAAEDMALRLAVLGFGVTPVDGKAPYETEWQKKLTRSPHVITEILQRTQGQYGLVPWIGERMLILDIDRPELFPPELRALLPARTFAVESSPGKGHRYYRMPEGFDASRLPAKAPWGEIRVSGASRCVVGPYSRHVDDDGRYDGGIYQPHGQPEDIAEIPLEALEMLAPARPNGAPAETFGGYHLPAQGYQGSRYEAIRDYIASRYARGLSVEELWSGVRDVLAPLFGRPLSEVELRERFDRAWKGTPERIDRAEAREEREVGERQADAWPDPLAEAAYHGVLGDITRAVAPYTEADEVGVLGTLLTMFGVACGGHRYLYQGAAQRANLSVLLVGETGFRGRKGTALDVARSVFRLAYPDLDGLWLVGVASGEAISGHLSREIDGQPRYEIDERVLLVEPEFGRVLTIMGRQGSTLSEVLRNAWDGVPLGHARARDEALVGRHHVALLGHVTPVELRAKLTDVDAANGFVNRLLMLAVRRQRLIPFPESPDELVRPYIRPLHEAIMAARSGGAMHFDAAARDRWESFYFAASLAPRLGLAGAVTGRHEAQVARLALVYALADRSSSIGAAHLEAAIAFAEYAARSVRWALGDSTGNRHADILRRMLADDGEMGWKDAKLALGLRTAADMVEVVDVLVEAGIAEVVSVAPTDGRGRPRRVIRTKGAKGAKDATPARSSERETAT